jgi:hypothetical protein
MKILETRVDTAMHFGSITTEIQQNGKCFEGTWNRQKVADAMWK